MANRITQEEEHGLEASAGPQASGLQTPDQQAPDRQTPGQQTPGRQAPALYGQIAILTVLLIPWLSLQSQDRAEEGQEAFLQHMESILESLDDESSGQEAILESLEWLYMNPINLNRATARDLSQLFILTDLQINKLLEHIRQHGQLISLYELQTIDGFDIPTIEAITPFVSLLGEHPRRHFGPLNMMRDGQHVLFLRYQQLLEEQKGFSAICQDELEANPNARYLGHPARIYTRYRYTYYQNVSIGITAEKDPGEEFFRGTQSRGFDFYSAHLHLRDMGRLKALSLGDYLVQFGQGLTLWRGMAFGKSAESIAVKKNGMGLRQYTGVDENDFMRGLGATCAIGPFELTAFWSSKKRDANILEVRDDGTMIISSLQTSGLHRTPRELYGRKAVKEEVAGSHLSWSRKGMAIGLTAFRMRLHAEYQRRLSFHNQFDFSSNSYGGLGIHYQYLFRNLNIFGEAAVGDNGRWAFLNGLMIGLDRNLSLALAHRHYDRAYQNPLSAAFGENTRTANESGLYLAADIRVSPQIRLNAFADHFRFPWMKHRTYMPSRGSDYLLNLHYRPERNIEFILRFRKKSKPLNTRDESVRIRHLDPVIRTQYRLHVAYPLSQHISLRSRLEFVVHQYGKEKQEGFMVYQDLLYRNLNSPLALTLRFALFDTDGFDARIYAYEHDVLYAFSFPFYSDKGMRNYLLIRYRLHRQIDLYLRLAQTFYTNRRESGSGLDQIEGNTRTEVKGQLRLRF